MPECNPHKSANVGDGGPTDFRGCPPALSDIKVFMAPNALTWAETLCVWWWRHTWNAPAAKNSTCESSKVDDSLSGREANRKSVWLEHSGQGAPDFGDGKGEAQEQKDRWKKVPGGCRPLQ